MCQLAGAQYKPAAYGKIDDAEMKLTTCAFDPDADALILLDLGKATYVSSTKHDFKIVVERRVRIKILKENGIDNANQKLRFYAKDDYERVSDVKGMTYNVVNGEVVTTKLESKNVYTQKVDNKYSQVVFTMPAVKVGSIIEYKYITYRESEIQLDDWYFQDKLPKAYSEYDIHVPQYFEFTTLGITNLPVDIKQNEYSDRINASAGTLNYQVFQKTYSMKDLPGVRLEPYMTTPKDYIQQIQFQFSAYVINYRRTDVRNTWDKMTRSLNEDEEFGMQLKKRVPINDSLKSAIKAAPTETARLQLIYNFVKNNMQYNGSETFWSADGIKQAFQKHSGSSGDINLLLINLLDDAGIAVRPLLVSSRDHGNVNQLYPFMYQFNNVLAYATADGKTWVLDATDKYNSTRMIPYDFLNRSGFLINGKKDGEWISLESDQYKYTQLVNIIADINEEGLLKGTALVRSSDYAKNTRQAKWESSKDKFNEYFASANYASLKIDDLKIGNLNEDTAALDQEFKFETPLNSSGEYRYFSTNLFLTFEKNPFIADNRLTDIDFGYAQHYSLAASFTIPDDYKFEELPKSFATKLPESEIVIKRIMEVHGQKLSIQVDVDINRSFFPADVYPGVKEMYKRIYSILNEQVVIKKK